MVAAAVCLKKKYPLRALLGFVGHNKRKGAGRAWARNEVAGVCGGVRHEILIFQGEGGVNCSGAVGSVQECSVVSALLIQ